jgi:glutamine cyclotransferase
MVTAAMALCGAALGVWAVDQTGQPAAIAYEIVNTYPHDPRAYCQGLVFDGGALYESTGQYGQSTLRRVNLETGQTEQQIALQPRYFGEGITVWNDQIVQLTWQQQTAFIYDKTTFREIARFSYREEGWGLTHDGQSWIMSDGTPTLRYIDPASKRVTRRLTVRSGGRRVNNLNELEFIEGEIYANVWYKDYILRISPQTGDVTGWIDLGGLHPPQNRRNRDEVLNGIAYDAEHGRLFVTGKNWPRLFELRLSPR